MTVRPFDMVLPASPKGMDGRLFRLRASLCPLTLFVVRMGWLRGLMLGYHSMNAGES